MTLLPHLGWFRSLALARVAPLLVVVSLALGFGAGCGGGGSTPVPTLTSIAVTPTNPSVLKGAPQQFTATGTYSDASTKDLTTMAVWTSGSPAVAAIAATGRAATLTAGTTVVTATSGAVSGSTTLTVMAVPKKLASIAITPTSPSIAKGSMQQLAATGTYDDNTTQDLTATVTWASATATVATVSTTGLATAVAPGSAVITATSGTITAMTTLTVKAAKLVSIAITPMALSVAKGSTQQLTATGTFDDATTQDLTTMVSWTSDKPAVATVAAAGLATAVDGGTATLTARFGSAGGAIMGSTTLTVTVAKLVSLAITPATPTIATGTKQQLTATGTFDDNTTQDLTNDVAWSSGTPATATISTVAGAKGQATAVAVGTTVITAADVSGTITATTTLTVKQADLISLAVTPANPSLAKGTKQKLVATGTFADTTTQDLTTQVAWASATEAKATISNVDGSRGEATAVDVGTSVISAKLGTITGSTTITVTDAKLVSLAVTPTNPSLARSTRARLVATGTFSDATTQNVTSLVTWTSGTVATATISNANDSKGVVTAVAPGTSVITATLTGVMGTTTLTVRDATLVSIVVTPDVPSIASGSRQQFVATGFFSDASRQDLTETATWASMTAAAATISNANGTKGLATGVAVGTSRITATIGTVSDNTVLTVTTAVMTSIAITPASPSVAKGTKLNLVATATFSNGTTQNVTNTVTWNSGTAAVATISNADGSRGQLTAVEEGTAVISAATPDLSATLTLTVTKAALLSIAVTPATPSIAKGTTQAFVATGTFSDQTTQVLTTTVTWASTVPAKATISNAAGTNGIATALATGDTVISATSGAISGNTALTINDGKLKSLAVTPAVPSLAAGTTLQMVATGTFDDGATQDLTTEVTWESATAAAAKVSNADKSEGRVTAVAKGTSVITATLGTLNANTTVTVTSAQLLSIVVTPAAPSIAKGRTQQFTATGFFDDTTTQDLTDTVTWSSTTAATASVSNADDSKGLATALVVGMTNIRAALGTVSGTASLRVTQAVLSSLAVTPATPSIAKGTRQQLVATGTFSDGTTQVLTTTVTWASATVAAATISNATGSRGLATSVAVGTTDISATSGTVVGHAQLTVTAATLVSLAVTPVNPSLARNAKQQFVATGTYTDASTQNLTTMVTWASTMEAVASISNAAATKGLATGLTQGTTQISATIGGATGRTTLTVMP